MSDLDQLTGDQARLIELFDGLPPEVQAVALDALRHLADREHIGGPFTWLLGAHITRREPGHAECELQVTQSHLNPARIAHGGVVYSLADIAMGTAVMAMLEPGNRCVTAELKVNYLEAVAKGRVIASANVVRLGGRLATATAEIRSDDGELVAIAVGTFAIVRGAPAYGPVT